MLKLSLQIGFSFLHTMLLFFFNSFLPKTISYLRLIQCLPRSGICHFSKELMWGTVVDTSLSTGLSLLLGLSSGRSLSYVFSKRTGELMMMTFLIQYLIVRSSFDFYTCVSFHLHLKFWVLTTSIITISLYPIYSTLT